MRDPWDLTAVEWRAIRERSRETHQKADEEAAHLSQQLAEDPDDEFECDLDDDMDN